MASWMRSWNLFPPRHRTSEVDIMWQQPYIHIWQNHDKTSWNAVFAIRLTSYPAEHDRYLQNRDEISQRFQEQVSLINSLFFTGQDYTFAIRYIASPHPLLFSAGSVETILLSKTVANEMSEAEKRAQSLCHSLYILLSGRMPDHSWNVVADEESFHLLWKPFDWNQAEVTEVRRRENLIHLQKYCSRPTLGQERITSQELQNPEMAIYFVHPFAPRFTTLAGLLRIFLLYHVPLVFQVTIAPARLSHAEEEALMREIGKCERYRQRKEVLALKSTILSGMIHEMQADVICEKLLSQLLCLQNTPFLLNIALASPQQIPEMIISTVGAEFSAETGNYATSSIRDLQTGGYNIAVPKTEKEKQLARQNIHSLDFELWGKSSAPDQLHRLRSLVSAYEAAGVFRFPLATAEGLPGLEVHIARTRPLPREVALIGQNSEDEETLLIGENHYFGSVEPVSLTEHDRRQHTYIVGQTGTGKTTLLKTMIIEDIKKGRGIAVIDPHGDLFDELLCCIPKNRIDDVVILDPTDTEFPVGLNMLECRNEEQRHFIVREMRSIMERLIRDQYEHAAVDFAGPVFYQHMQMNMLLAMSDPDDPGTLLDFYEIFQHKWYWKKWLPLKWKDPQLERWTSQNLPNIDYLKRYSESATWGEYLSSKFEDFVFDPKLRLIFGQKLSTINLRQIMDEEKILMVNLAKGELAEANSRFFGMVLMAKIMAAAMSRTEIPVEERKPFYLYVDEFQSLATQSFTLLLSEARKFGLGLVLANQFVSQIKDERIVQAIFGNVGTLISFRLGRTDADLLVPYFSPYFTHLDLTSLPNWHACIKTTVNGQSVTPFTLHTAIPEEPLNTIIAQQVRDRSRRTYGHPRKKVEEEITKILKYEEEE